MVEVLEDLSELPIGSHALSFHASDEEAAEHAVEFLEGTPEGQAAAYWVPDRELAREYDRRLIAEAPRLAGCVFALPHSQAVPIDGHRRPAPEIMAEISRHPEGITAAGQTITEFWTPDEVPEYLEYEAWFDRQPRERSRFLCPYDLRRLPPRDAPRILRELGAHHSQVVLSHVEHPAIQLLQLFVFTTESEVPPSLRGVLRWAIAERIIEVSSPSGDFHLTAKGDEIVQHWSSMATVGW